MTDEKLEKSKTLFGNLQTDVKSVLFTEEKRNEKPFKKFKKPKQDKDFTFANLFDGNINVNDDEKKSTPIKMTFVEKNYDIDRPTLYSFDCPFQLLHAKIGNLEFWENQQLIQNIVFCLWIFSLLKSTSSQ